MSSLVRGLRALTAQHWGMACVCALLVTVLMPLQTFDVNTYWKLNPSRISWDLGYYLVAASLFLVAIAWVDATIPSGRVAPLWLHVRGIAAACIASLAVAAAIADVRPWPPRVIAEGREYQGPERTRGLKIYLTVQSMGLSAVLHGSLVSFMFLGLRNARRSASMLAAAELARAEASRRLLDSRARAADAAVDPEALVAALRDVERTYEMDPMLAEARLDELIGVLREAIPRLRPAVEAIEA